MVYKDKTLQMSSQNLSCLSAVLRLVFWGSKRPWNAKVTKYCGPNQMNLMDNHYAHRHLLADLRLFQESKCMDYKYRHKVY